MGQITRNKDLHVQYTILATINSTLHYKNDHFVSTDWWLGKQNVHVHNAWTVLHKSNDWMFDNMQCNENIFYWWARLTRYAKFALFQYFERFSREYSDAKRFEYWYSAMKLSFFISLFFVVYNATDSIMPSTCKQQLTEVCLNAHKLPVIHNRLVW